MTVKSLEEIANTLGLTIREPKKYPLELYVKVSPDKLIEVVKKLMEDYSIYFLSTIQALEAEEGYHLLYPFSVDLETKSKKGDNLWGKIVLDVTVSKNNPEVDSLTNEIPGANVYEREAYDMLGIKFKDYKGEFFDHTQPMRLLTADIMPPDLFPLRKECSYTEIREVLAKEAKKREEELKE